VKFEEQGYDQEERYFAQREAELRRRRREEFREQIELSERDKLREQHYMHCPKCGQVLKEILYHEVPVDICPFCQGMWLDKGELEQLSAKTGGIVGFFRSMFRLEGGPGMP
jgi:uncharacterized protein